MPDEDVNHLNELRAKMHLISQTPAPATGKGSCDDPFAKAQAEYKAEMERLHKLGYEYRGLPRRG